MYPVQVKNVTFQETVFHLFYIPLGKSVVRKSTFKKIYKIHPILASRIKPLTENWWMLPNWSRKITKKYNRIFFQNSSIQNSKINSGFATLMFYSILFLTWNKNKLHSPFRIESNSSLDNTSNGVLRTNDAMNGVSA